MKRLLLLGVSLGIAASSFAQGLNCTGGLSWGTQVGQTGYDLHSNSAVANRIVRNADGSLSVVWIDHYDELTTSNAPKSIRGLGYNHFDPTSGWTGGTGAGSGECWEERNGCASDYIGWPEIINTTAGKEVVMSHYVGTGNEGNSMTTRAQYGVGGINSWGTTAFTSIDTLFDVTGDINNFGGTWPRAVNVDETIHMILAFSGDGDPYIPLRDIHGVDDPIRYYRSQDAGATWDITNYDFAGLVDSTDIERVGGDSYAIHAKGSTVAITFGAGVDGDWLMLKSTDGGDTWNKSVIRDNHPQNIAADTHFTTASGARGYITNNDDFELVIDDNGTVHLFAGMTWYDDAGFLYPPGDGYRSEGNGMLYWKEGMLEAEVIATPDYKANPLGDDTLYDIKQTPYYGSYVLGWPTASVDAAGNIFMVYSALNENSVTYINPLQTTDTSGFHDLYMVYSLDNGSTWCNGDSFRINIAEDLAGKLGGTPTQDDIFPTSVANIASDNIMHVLWQGDWSSPGLALRSDTYPHASDNCNYITYAGLDVSNVTKCGESPVVVNNISEKIKENINFNVVPNPATNVAVVTAEKLINNISLINMFGQVVKSDAVNGATTYTVNVSDLTEGMYVVMIETEAGTATQKLNIIK